MPVGQATREHSISQLSHLAPIIIIIIIILKEWWTRNIIILLSVSSWYMTGWITYKPYVLASQSEKRVISCAYFMLHYIFFSFIKCFELVASILCMPFSCLICFFPFFSRRGGTVGLPFSCVSTWFHSHRYPNEIKPIVSSTSKSLIQYFLQNVSVRPYRFTFVVWLMMQFMKHMFILRNIHPARHQCF